MCITEGGTEGVGNMGVKKHEPGINRVEGVRMGNRCIQKVLEKIEKGI